MSRYQFGKPQNCEIIKFYVGVKKGMNEKAKERGAKFDPNEKKWYFQYQLNEFNKNDNSETYHTYEFTPFKMDVHFPEDMHKSTVDLKRGEYWDRAKIRHLIYMDNVKRLESQKPEPEIIKEKYGPSMCEYCIGQKLSECEVNEFHKYYEFSVEACAGCIQKFKLSQYI